MFFFCSVGVSVITVVVCVFSKLHLNWSETKGANPKVHQKRKKKKCFLMEPLSQACLVAIIVPDPDYLPGWAKKKGFHGSYEELCRSTVMTCDELNGFYRLLLSERNKETICSLSRYLHIVVHVIYFDTQENRFTPDVPMMEIRY